jgi:nicotinamidase-related amidase
MSPHKLLPLPRFFEPNNAEKYEYAPNQQQLFADAAEWRRAHGITPAASDEQNIHLLLIDVQRDFCFPTGSLYVRGRSGRGALDDSRRIAEFVYRNLNVLTNVTTTMDTHFAFQIFFPSFWVDKDDKPLAPFREITTDDIDRGDVRPNPAVASWLCNGNYPWLLKQARFYCAELETAGKYKLYLWPPHCILGSDGHALVGVLHEARMFHSFARGVQSWVEVKGGNALTENYSVLRPEVLARHDGQPLAQRNTAFIKTLLTANAVVIAGQAASHCVKSSIDDLLDEIVAQDKALARKVYILSDCMSSVTVPDGKGGFIADFTPQAEQALQRFADAGMRVVRSTDGIASWPGIHLS